MITLKRLDWSNCFSYGENNSLALDEVSVTQIVGTNGVGKSSIPLIIEEVLYNKNSKGIKKADIPNRYVGKGYSIKIIFSKDEDTYTVSVERNKSIKVVLEKNGVDISSHTATNTYKSIQEIIGVDFKNFSQLVYQSTSSSLQFLTATDTNRKKFLIDLLHLENYVELFEVFKNEAREVSLSITGLEASISTIEKWLKDNKLTDTTILPMQYLEIDTDGSTEEVLYLRSEIENIISKNRKISKNNQLKELLSQLNLDEVRTSEVKKKESYDTLQAELGNCSQVAIESQKLLNKLNTLGDSCPTCEQDVDKGFIEALINIENTKVTEAKEKVKLNEEEIKRIKRQNNEFDRLQNIEKDWTEIYRSINHSLPQTTLDKAELEERLERVQNELLEARGKLAEQSRINEEITQRNTRIIVIQEQTDKFKEELNTLNSSLATKVSLLSNLEILKKSFSTNGLLAYKIENLVKELEELTNKYLAELSDGRFTLEFVITNDKLNVVITDAGNAIDILALSSGELARVNTATLIAIRKLMSSISKTKLNILFLDEVIAVLDEEGKEKLIEVLLEEDLNTYVVSHGWTHPLLEKIEVSKEANISRME